MEDNILEIRNLTKRFEGITAVDDVSFSVQRGEIHALMGENGAGKSTIIKIITGLYRADSGQIIYDNKERSFHSALSAQHAGISTVYQELNMIPTLTVSENIFLGRYPYNTTGIDWKAMNDAAQNLVEDLGVSIDVRKPLSVYGTAQKQITYILRAINLKSKLIVFDEPTSSLDSNEVDLLFGIIERLKKNNVAVIFITHRLDEVYRICARISILKDGKYEGTYLVKELSQYDLLTKMVGKKNLGFDHKIQGIKRDLRDEECVLEVKNITRIPYVHNVSFRMFKGEILGLAGLLGSGRTETARIIFGCDIPDSGEVLIGGDNVNIKSPKDAVSKKLAFCTENRREEGLFPDMSVQDNIVVCSLPQVIDTGLINETKLKKISKEYISKLFIKTPSDQQLIKHLSGGNQQKVILSRWLAMDPKIMILDEPTRGIDIGGKIEIENLIEGFSKRGISILLISSELGELVSNCDRIIVLRDGRVLGELCSTDISEKNIMLMIAQNKNNSPN